MAINAVVFLSTMAIGLSRIAIDPGRMRVPALIGSAIASVALVAAACVYRFG